ncbi:MAG: succinate dehydrogenase, hydrophobic membrane anchor protein [Sphingobacteriales bacterium]|nr:MAG: succinate dehydrogenase, hydrophobic membrane anchor protein [Sphingobacteriales bacterium]
MRSATGLTGSGSRDWIVQRVSAVILAVYTVVILGWILFHPGFGYTEWYGFMMTLPMKTFSLLALVSLVGHGWVGMWTVFTDYVTASQVGPSAHGVRLVLQSAMIIALFVFMVWGIQIFWAH